ncbi:MAG: hypothetical protein HZC55_04085 [Verrucomicrobia bacterium]|nr:hypothetical protein [Verrucomicrobiota bacterium]
MTPLVLSASIHHGSLALGAGRTARPLALGPRLQAAALVTTAQVVAGGPRGFSVRFNSRFRKRS